jgi:hypothetical protein
MSQTQTLNQQQQQAVLLTAAEMRPQQAWWGRIARERTSGQISQRLQLVTTVTVGEQRLINT